MKRFLCMIMVLALMLSAIPALAYEELAKGSKGDAVVELQERLNKLGYSVGTADGDFGNKTYNALIQFQQDNGFEATGIADERTMEAINKMLEPSAEDEEESPASIKAELPEEHIIECVYDIVGEFSEGLAPVCKNGKFGYIDLYGQLVIPCQFDLAYQFSEGYARVYDYNKGLFGYIDKTGDLVIFHRWNLADDFSDGLAKVFSGGKAGFIDTNGNMVIDYSINTGYDLGDFRDGLCIRKKQGPTSSEAINKTGEVVVPYEDYYLYSSYIKKGFLWANKKGSGLSGVIDAQTGETLIPFEWDSIPPCGWAGNNEVCVLKHSSMYGLIDISGKLITELKYPEFVFYSEEYERFVFINDAGEYECVNADGELVWQAAFDKACAPGGDFILPQGLFAVKINSQWGLCNMDGTIVIPCIYEYVFSGNENRYLVQTAEEYYFNGRGFPIYDYIDEAGNVIIDNVGFLRYYWSNGTFESDEDYLSTLAFANGSIQDGQVIHFDRFNGIIDEIGLYSESKHAGELPMEECQEYAIAYMKMHLQNYLKNPSSLQINDVVVTKTEDSQYMFFFTISAMNSLGGYTTDYYVCYVNYLTGEVTEGGMI